jgi:hypothetical protein
MHKLTAVVEAIEALPSPEEAVRRFPRDLEHARGAAQAVRRSVKTYLVENHLTENHLARNLFLKGGRFNLPVAHCNNRRWTRLLLNRNICRVSGTGFEEIQQLTKVLTVGTVADGEEPVDVDRGS